MGSSDGLLQSIVDKGTEEDLGGLSPAPFRRFDLLERRVAAANDPDRRHHRRRRVPRGLAKPTLDKIMATLAPAIARIVKV
jgi:hypothetical protein